MGILGSRAAATPLIALVSIVVAGCGGHTTSTTVTVTASTPTASTPSASTPAATTETGTSTAATTAATPPVLGAPNAYSNSAGFGEVAPSHVFLGGDPTGDFLGLRWRGWGGPAAVATGFGNYPPPNGPVSASTRQPIRVLAFDLGPCKGQTAYRQMTVTFYTPQPQPGSTFKTCHSG